MALIGEATLLTYLYFKKKREGGKENSESEENKQDGNEEEGKATEEVQDTQEEIIVNSDSTEATETLEKDKVSRSNSEISQSAEDQPTATSRWRSLVAKSSLALQTSKESASATAAAKKEAAAIKLKATQEAASAAATTKKEAASTKLKETGDSLKNSTNSASEKLKNSGTAVKSSSATAASSINASFWNVVQLAQKVRISDF